MINRISGKTKICAIIGNPVEHTVSPAMHNAAFQELGLDYVYVPFYVSVRELPQAVAGLRALNIAGFNVTLPFKAAILPLLFEVNAVAQEIGAVNTVVANQNLEVFYGEFIGYNTDAPGFIRALKENGIKPEGKKVVVLGAGGAARAITYALEKCEAHLTVLNRSGVVEWAENISKEIKVMELGRIGEALDGADLLVNATSVGMSPAADESLVPSGLLAKVPVVFDIVYNPVKTKMLKEAEKAGAQVISGLDMLVWQAALAFEMWTRCEAPFDLMRQEAIKALEHRED